MDMRDTLSQVHLSYLSLHPQSYSHAGWTYIFIPKLSCYRLPLPEFVEEVSTALLALKRRATSLERQWDAMKAEDVRSEVRTLARGTRVSEGDAPRKDNRMHRTRDLNAEELQSRRRDNNGNPSPRMPRSPLSSRTPSNLEEPSPEHEKYKAGWSQLIGAVKRPKD